MLLLPACQSATDTLNQEQELAEPPQTDLEFDAEKHSAASPEAAAASGAAAAVPAEGAGFYTFHGAGPRTLRQEEQDNCVRITPSCLHGSECESSMLTRHHGIRFYTLSIILGTVALSYGSVPMYKMVCT